jgi:hypothetical protein
MPAISKVESLTAAMANGVHDLANNVITCAFCNASNAPVATDTQLSDLTTIDHANMSSRVITTTSSTQISGVYRLILADLTITASGAVPTFRYIALYDETAVNDELLGWYDYGSDVTMANLQTFKCDFDGTNGVFSNT